MEIRKDFQEIEIFLYKLIEFSKVFKENNIYRWPHLKNKEDFHQVYNINSQDRLIFENLYSEGRNCAIDMTSKLTSFNYSYIHPTLTSFINSFENGCINEIDDLKKVLYKAKNKCKELKSHCPWAVEQMIFLFEDQLEILFEIKNTIKHLKQSEIYKLENNIKIQTNKGINMAKKIGIAASIATIISTVVLLFSPNNASNITHQKTIGNQSPNIIANNNSTIKYMPTTNNFYNKKEDNGYFLDKTFLYAKPKIDLKKNLCFVESGTKIKLLSEKKDTKIVGLTWIKVKIINGTCIGKIGWTSKEKLIKK